MKELISDFARHHSHDMKARELWPHFQEPLREWCQGAVETGERDGKPIYIYTLEIRGKTRERTLALHTFADLLRAARSGVIV